MGKGESPPKSKVPLLLATPVHKTWKITLNFFLHSHYHYHCKQLKMMPAWLSFSFFLCDCKFIEIMKG